MARARNPARRQAQTQTATGRPQGVAAPGTPPSFHNRAMPPIRNPVYRYNMSRDFNQLPQPTHALERPPPAPAGVDPRLTSQGSLPPVWPGRTPVAGMAYQTPYNVWGLFPA